MLRVGLMALPAQIEDITFFSFRFNAFMSLRSLATTVHLPLSHWRPLDRAVLIGPLISRLYSLLVISSTIGTLFGAVKI